MKPRRWMKTILAAARENEGGITLAWARQHRPKRAPAKPADVEAAE